MNTINSDALVFRIKIQIVCFEIDKYLKSTLEEERLIWLTLINENLPKLKEAREKLARFPIGCLLRDLKNPCTALPVLVDGEVLFKDMTESIENLIESAIVAGVLSDKNVIEIKNESNTRTN